MTGTGHCFRQPGRPRPLGNPDVALVPCCRGPAPNQALQRTARSRCSRQAAERRRYEEAILQNPPPDQLSPDRALRPLPRAGAGNRRPRSYGPPGDRRGKAGGRSCVGNRAASEGQPASSPGNGSCARSGRGCPRGANASRCPGPSWHAGASRGLRAGTRHSQV